jgi:oxepin-CoA hydrolase/3-oxo-5,6-dehydrosuberyl-CoA semialdehyde dehydrogenase
MTFAERGALLGEMARIISDSRDELLTLATNNGGNTRGDGKFDVDGGTAVLSAYAELAKELGDTPWIVEDEPASLFHGSKLRAQHISLPRHGLAIHINAFNFPAWGMLGKLATSILAGMPVLTKPATSTSLVAHRIVEILVDSNVLPEGALQLLMGPAGDLLDHVHAQDVVAFTGSANTGAKVRTHEAVIAHGVRVNVEADSLNAVVLGPGVDEGTELFDLAVRDLVTEMTQKAGQKCTATRRVLVPVEKLDMFREAVMERLSSIADKTGDPRDKANRMGPLATANQLRDAREGVEKLSEHASVLRGDPSRAEFAGVEAGKGYFFEPILLEASSERALDATAAFHVMEVFGPVCTLLPYDGTPTTAATIVALGRGSLVTTLYSDDRAWISESIPNIAPHLGRLVVADEKSARASMAPGCVFPVANHGGPGRAGCGGELGGISGLTLYMQRTALQGGASNLARIVGRKG